MNGIDWALSGPPTTAAWPGYDNDSFCDAPRQENTYHETQLALQIGYLDFLYEFYGMATGVRTELLGVLLAAAKTDDPQRWATWKQAGDTLLADKGEAGA